MTGRSSCPCRFQVVQGGEELALGQVARGPEQDERIGTLVIGHGPKLSGRVAGGRPTTATRAGASSDARPRAVRTARSSHVALDDRPSVGNPPR